MMSLGSLGMEKSIIETLRIGSIDTEWSMSLLGLGSPLISKLASCHVMESSTLTWISA